MERLPYGNIVVVKRAECGIASFGIWLIFFKFYFKSRVRQTVKNIVECQGALMWDINMVLFSVLSRGMGVTLWC